MNLEGNAGVVVDWVRKAEAFRPDVRDFVEGRWVSGEGQPLEKFSPRDGRLLYLVASGSTESVDRAIRNARHAFDDGRWAKLSLDRRKKALLELALLIESHRDELALLESLDVGKPIYETLNVDVPMAAALIRHAAEALGHHSDKLFAADASSLSYQLRRPVGVVAGIIGWNFPLVLAASKVGPALAMGNSLVLKPSEITSLSAARLAELAIAAGVPEGVLNVVHGGPGTGAQLARHAQIDLITFTGSSATGKRLLIAAGESNMKRLILECGGKAPSIVFDDAPDLNGVAEAVVMRAFWNQGQVCTASSRLLIQEGIEEDLLPLIINKVKRLQPTDPLDPDARYGALVSQAHLRKVAGYLEIGKQQGARTAYQGSAPPPHATGFFAQPIVFDGVLPGHAIAQEEIFGPVLSVMSFQSEEDAIRIANGTIYGLSAILWTKNVGRAHRITQGINAGSIVVNATGRPTGGPSPGVLSVGGHKQSGLGVEGGVEGLEAYTTTTAVQYFV